MKEKLLFHTWMYTTSYNIPLFYIVFTFSKQCSTLNTWCKKSVDTNKCETIETYKLMFFLPEVDHLKQISMK